MKHVIQKRWGGPSCSALTLSTLTLSVLILASGCTQFAAKRTKARQQLDEHSRALTTAVVDTLHLQPEEHRDHYTQFALRLAREDQRIEGLPLDPVPVEAVLGLSATNPPPQVVADQQRKAERALEKRFTEIEKLLAREHKATQPLLEFGERYEAARNRSIIAWAKAIGGGTVLLGGIIALMVFVPGAIPIFGRLLGWIVGKFPSAAGAVGVVSVKAFDAVVKGIERTKAGGSSSTVHLSNGPYDRPESFSSTWVDDLHLNLSREMDAAHKALVRSRKTTLN